MSRTYKFCLSRTNPDKYHYDGSKAFVLRIGRVHHLIKNSDGMFELWFDHCLERGEDGIEALNLIEDLLTAKVQTMEDLRKFLKSCTVINYSQPRDDGEGFPPQLQGLSETVCKFLSRVLNMRIPTPLDNGKTYTKLSTSTTKSTSPPPVADNSAALATVIALGAIAFDCA